MIFPGGVLGGEQRIKICLALPNRHCYSEHDTKVAQFN